MASRKSISAELFEEIERRDYCQYVDLFPRMSPMTTTDLRMFRNRTKDRYLVETNRFYSRKGTTKPDGIYELFGKMVNKSADKLREDLVEWSNLHRAEVTEAGTVMLNNDKKDYSWWILMTTHRKNSVDELSLWGLCKMLFKHAMVYTPDYTWTTLRDKSLEIDEIDKICEVHLAYMGYGKFASITPKDMNVTVGVQPTLQTLSVKPKPKVPTPKQPINRTRHGQHPTRTTSAHINYFDLNQGDSAKERKSPRKQKRRSVSALTLRTLSESRLASQTHIEREKEKQASTESAIDIDIQITATLPPDEDGIAFTRTLPTKPRAKIERNINTKTTTSSKVLNEPPQPQPSLLRQKHVKQPETVYHEKDEHVPKIRTTTKDVLPTATIGDDTIEQQSPPKSQRENEPQALDMTKPMPSNKITTVAEINVCEKHFHLSQQLLPLLDLLNIKREDVSNRNDDVTQEPEREKDDHDMPALAIQSANNDSSTPDIQPQRSSKNEKDEQTFISLPQPEKENQDKIPRQVKNENKIETDEQTMHAADGLLMLQELANFDNPDIDEDINSQLMPIGTKQTPANVDFPIGDATDLQTTATEPQKDDTSDETIIYDASDLADLDATASKTQPGPVPSKPEPEKDEQLENDDCDKKGMLVICEDSLRKGGTQKDTEDDTPMPTITSSGKVRCNFCRRDFNTLSEQKQHMSRRHPEQLREQEEKRKCEKDECIEREQFKQAIEALKKQELEKKKKRKKSTESRENKKSPKQKSKQEKHEKDEPQPKRPKTSDDSTSSLRQYNCPSENCDRSFNTQAELNKHHKDTHPPVICTVCKKVCSTPNTLDRHMYKHRSTLECQYCDEKFAFRSELEIHQAVHDEEPSFYCKSCTRSFMRIGDLKEHEESHTGNIHYCTVKGCDFSAPLKCYVRTHIKTTHASKDALPYPCTKCNRRFKFYEQRKRHIANDHQ